MSIVNYLFHSISSGQCFRGASFISTISENVQFTCYSFFGGDVTAFLCVGTVCDQIGFDHFKDLCIVMNDQRDAKRRKAEPFE